MTKMLICPICGRYQEDTTNIRKAGVAAKKAGMYAGKFALKYGFKAAVGAVGFDGEYTQRAAGMAADGISEAIGLDPSKVCSMSEVTYKCSYCNQYWEGQDSPGSYNDIQKKTVENDRKVKLATTEQKYKSSLKKTFISLAFVALAFWIWSERVTTQVTNDLLLFTTTSTDYSWHYYIFWPLVIISGYFTLICILETIGNYKEHNLLKDISLPQYARMYMQLGK